MQSIFLLLLLLLLVHRLNILLFDSTQRNSMSVARSDKPWVPPDPEIARLYASYNHPRKGGEGGEKYDWREMTSTIFVFRVYSDKPFITPLTFESNFRGPMNSWPPLRHWWVRRAA